MAFDVSIFLRLVDRLTAPSRKAGQSYQQMANNITRSSGQIRSASTAAAASVGSIGTAFGRANAHAKGYFANLRKMQAQATAGARGNTMIGGNGMVRGFGSYVAFRSILNATEETARSENKFRALVDNVTATQMRDIRGQLMARMMKTGETYAMLLDAAGDAAQIVGSANMAADIATTASKLANIDTAGKDVSYFAETLAAILGPNGTVADLKKLGDILAMQQKLGAATAGGTIEAFKNVVAQQQLHGADMADALTAIGLIKNFAPAIQDSTLGIMGKYAIRTLAAPTNEFRKKLREAGIGEADLYSDGSFDISKTQRFFSQMIQTEKGFRAFKELFAGKNVQAGDFWSIMAKIDPKKFDAYYTRMTGGDGELDATDLKRLEGIVGPLNALRASLFRLSLAFGELVTPAVVFFGKTFGSIAPVIGDVTKEFSESLPVLSGIAGTWLALVGSLGMLGLFSNRAAVLAGFFARLPVSLVTGFAAGIAGAATSIISMTAAAFRARGILGGLLFTLRGLAGGFAIYLVWKGVEWFYENWDRIMALVKKPLKVDIIFPELPGWLQKLMGGTAQIGRDFADVGQGTYQSPTDPSQKSVVGIGLEIIQGLRRIFGGGGGDLDRWAPSFAGLAQAGIPESVRRGAGDASGSAGAQGALASPQAITNNTNSHNTSIVNHVTVNATTNADPNAIGAAAANAVGSKVRGALSDAPHSAP